MIERGLCPFRSVLAVMGRRMIEPLKKDLGQEQVRRAVVTIRRQVGTGFRNSIIEPVGIRQPDRSVKRRLRSE
jgi:hypothetical protein